MKTFAKSGLAIAVGLACFSAIADTTSSASDNNDIEQIVVTGQKLSRSLQDTKESVAVFTNELLETRNLESLTDVFIQTPGVTGDSYSFRIRGVRNSDGASSPNRGDLASVVVDGVTLSGWIKSEGAGQLWDVSQVEILRGPQSTNLGRNALAGAVIVNTMDPTFYNEGAVRIGFGEYGKTELKGVANLNIKEDVSAIRLSVENTQSDGFVNNITRNEDDYGNSDKSIYRLKWLFQPTDDIKSVFSYQRIESEYGLTTTILGDYKKEDRISIAGDDSLFVTEADLLSLNIDYKFSDAWSLKSITAYQNGHRTRLSDTDQTPRSFGEGGGTVSQDNEDKNWSQELRFNYESGALRGSTGVYISSVDAKYNQKRNLDLTLAPLFDEYSPGLGNVLTTDAVFGFAIYQPYFDTIQDGLTYVTNKNWALFSEWELAFGDNWLLSFGLRYDNEKQDFSTASTTKSNYPVPAFLAPPLGDTNLGIATLNQVIGLINNELQAFTAPVPLSAKTESFSNLLPHVGITYDWSNDVSTSFFVKKSYRSGGSELTLLNGVNHFDAEELWNYEASLRAISHNGKGVFNANVYFSDWTDQQVSVQEPGTTNSVFVITENVGKSNLSGLELSFDYELSETLSIYTGLALSKTEYKEFGDASGNTFAFAPENTAVLGFNYAHSNGFFANANISYVDTSFSNVANTMKINSYTLLNLNGGYELDDWKLEVYAKNATDELYDSNNNLSNDDGTPATILGAPREVGARITYRF